MNSYIVHLFCFLVISVLVPALGEQDIRMFALQLNSQASLHPIYAYPGSERYLAGFPIASYGSKPFVLKTDLERRTNASSFAEATKLYDLTQKDVKIARKDYFKLVYDYFCHDPDSTNEKKHHTCCIPEEILRVCTASTDRIKIVLEIAKYDVEQLNVVFLFMWCQKFWDKYKSTKDDSLLADLLYYCPNPCIMNPCNHEVGVNKQAGCTTYGPYENEYNCTCLDNYDWDKQRQACVPQHPCHRDLFPYCVSNNTEACIASSTDAPKCVCKYDYTGLDCALPFDACMERQDRNKSTGNQNCQVHLGNLCHPHLGKDSYHCSCSSGFVPIASFEEDNCNLKPDPCKQDNTLIASREDLVVTTQSINCLNGGQCVSSGDYTRVACICPKRPDGSPLSEGLNCELPVGVWSGWSRFSPCQPQTCGDTRYKWRRRVCLNSTNYADAITSGGEYSVIVRCAGASEEIVPCPNLASCEQMPEPIQAGEQSATLYYFTIFTLAQLGISFALWIIFVAIVIPCIINLMRRSIRF